MQDTQIQSVRAGAEPDDGSSSRNVNEESLPYVIAGMISTLSFTPSYEDPERCLEMAENIIRHVRNVPTDVPNY